ncbi:hypothetical protein [Escherichia phage vB-Eco-KMB37]|nr:hypothetical protein [Escherichia phage vB-Eco-KMB37]
MIFHTIAPYNLPFVGYSYPYLLLFVEPTFLKAQ